MAENSLFWIGVILFLSKHEILATTNLVYTPSDAYQESLLRPYRSYSDAAIFHFSVPTQTVRAMWQFVAFMDDPVCTSRDVHIYLRHGSYPVVSADNSSFPDELEVPSEYIYALQTTTSFQPKEMPEFHLLNPLPGSWFGVAFIPDWNHEIKIEGISHRCRYSLGSMAAWTLQNNIHLLTVEVPTEIVAVSQMNFFKFHVPEGAWKVTVSISDCTGNNATNGSVADVLPCVEEFGIRADGLPFSEAVNTTSGSQEFIKTVLQPQTNSYYYLLVISQHRTSYTIKINVHTCTMFWHQLHTKHALPLPAKKPPDSWYNDWSRALGKSGSGGKLEEGCLPVVPLTRVKHAQDFLDSFLLQGHDWFSSWLAVTDLFPVIVKFDLLPFVDIGGTLQVKVHLDSLINNLTSQVVQVSACIRRLRPPVPNSSDCPTVSSNGSLVAARYFPFPVPGCWYLSFAVACFNRTGDSEPCELQQVMIDLSVRLQPCVFEGQPCGSHGFCRENHFRQFYFSSCQCLSGWKGWGCTDGRNSVSTSLQLMKTLLLTLSNLFFVPAVVLAARRRLYTEAVVYGLTMFFSTFYHACDVDTYNFCLMKYDVLQFCDFYSAILSFWMTVVAMAGLSETLTSVAHVTGALGIALGVEYQRTDLWVFVVPLCIGIFMLFISWGCRCYQLRACITVKLRSLVQILSGAALAIVGLALFAFVETEENYKYIHSVWHAVIAISIILLLPPAKAAKSQEAQPPPVYSIDDSELLDIAEYRLNSDITALFGGVR